jgi:hypothetical protein
MTKELSVDGLAKFLTEYKIASVDEKDEASYSCFGCKYSPNPPDDCYLEGAYDGTPCKICFQEAKAILSYIQEATND